MIYEITTTLLFGLHFFASQISLFWEDASASSREEKEKKVKRLISFLIGFSSLYFGLWKKELLKGDDEEARKTKVPNCTVDWETAFEFEERSSYCWGRRARADDENDESITRKSMCWCSKDFPTSPQ